MATWRSPENLREDPWVAEQVRKAIARWEGTLLPEELAWATEQLFEILANDPRAAKVLNRAHPKIGDTSGDVERDPSASDEAERRGSKG